jgi:hypothetical protein
VASLADRIVDKRKVQPRALDDDELAAYPEAARRDRIVIWLYADHARDLLRGLSTGAVALTHQPRRVHEPAGC